MAIVLTEVGLNGAGEMVVEIHNNGALAVDLSAASIALNPAGTFSFVNVPLAGLGSIAPSQTYYLAHPNIGGDLTSTDFVGGYAFVAVDIDGSTPFDDEIGTFSDGSPLMQPNDLYRTSDPSQSMASNPPPLDVFPSTTPGVACFAAGTLIATPTGETPVEGLLIGDLVTTADGRAVPVKWIGRQTILKRFAGERAQLVRIAAGALGNHSDLFVTGDHGMVLDGFVVNASALVNGRSIDWVSLADTPDAQTVYHVETEAHDVILANGAASETYLDVPGRRAFDNYQEYLDLYGANAPIAESQLPRISSARLLPERLRRALAA